MGRRSTKTTKTGKFMNPTDQWRKQLRKKELKKNKQQRSAVREAVLKNKNPHTILAEIEEIEKMEIESGHDELPAEKGLKEKKRKLHETLQRIILFHERQNPQQAQKIKELVVESEKKRRAMLKVYNSYRSARSQIDISDIPLPEGTVSATTDSVDTPLTKAPVDLSIPMLSPPSPPTGPPPNMQFPPAITIDDNSVHSDHSDASDSNDSSSDDESDSAASSDENEATIKAPPPPPPPPGPPPTAYQQPLPLFSAPPQYHHMAPPPHPLFNNKPTTPSTDIRQHSASNVQQPTISAQPQLRNVQAEVTKFMPTSLKVRRDQPQSVKAKLRGGHLSGNQNATTKKTNTTKVVPGMQGDAYETFMSEIQELL